LAVSFNRVCVAGVGLIGGSMALAMKRQKIAGRIVGVGRGEQNLKDAVRLGIIDSWTHEVREGVAGADLVILATPMSAMKELVRECRGGFKKGAILTEVGSTKKKMIDEVLPYIQPGVDFIPAHPIAGKEKSGAKYSDPEIFQGRWCIIVPTKKSSKAGVEKIRRLWTALGARVELMTALEHDRLLAAISHLPHLVAYALVGALLELDRQRPMLRFSAGGFRDFIRIAGSSPRMWADICMENKKPILDMIGNYLKQLERIKIMVEKEKSGELEQFFEECRKVKELVEKGHD
jgi:prephenate dehydrogenase